MPGISSILPLIILPLHTAIVEDYTGTERVRPVWKFTCDDYLGTTKVIINNITSGQQISWTGELDVGDVLEFDAEAGHIYLNDIEDMATMVGEFPHLWPGTNEIEIIGFSGTLNIIYRERYA